MCPRCSKLEFLCSYCIKEYFYLKYESQNFKYAPQNKKKAAKKASKKCQN